MEIKLRKNACALDEIKKKKKIMRKNIDIFLISP